MATNTPNINLVLPIGSEKVSRQVINDNNTKIDNAIGALPSGQNLQGEIDALNNKIANLVFVETHSENFTGGDGTKKETNVVFDNPHPGYSAHVIAVTTNAYDQNTNIYSYTQYYAQGKIAVYVEHNLTASANSLIFRVLYIKS